MIEKRLSLAGQTSSTTETTERRAIQSAAILRRNATNGVCGLVITQQITIPKGYQQGTLRDAQSQHHNKRYLNTKIQKTQNVYRWT